MINCSVVTYSTPYQMLERLVNATLENKKVSKIFIIDNSADTSLKSRLPSNNRIIYIHTGRNLGFGKAHNIALNHSLNDGAVYHAILNPDIYFQNQTLDTIADYLDTDTEIGLLMPKILYPNGEIQYLCKLLPTPTDWIIRRFFPFKKLINNRNQKFELRFTGYDRIMNVPFLSGCFMFFRINVLRELGLFDEKLFMYSEDTDISRRIHAKFKTIFHPEIIAYHDHLGGSHQSLKLLLIHIKSSVYYFNKWGWFIDRERSRINKEFLAEYNVNLD